MIRQKQAGYTIVEVMIFLAVTGGLFIIAFTAFNGQQQRTQFAQAVRGTESQIQDWINDVNTGNYSTVKVDCQAGPNGPSPTTSTGSDDTQGTNDQCIFVGKVVRIRSNGTIVLDTLAGNRIISGREVESIAEAKPSIVSQFSETYTTPYNIPITKAFVDSSTSLSGFMIVTSFGKTGSGGDLLSGSTSSRVLPLEGTINDTDGVYQTKIADEATLNTVETKPITICIQSLYENNKWGVIVVGSASGKLTTTSFITDTKPGGC